MEQKRWSWRPTFRQSLILALLLFSFTSAGIALRGRFLLNRAETDFTALEQELTAETPSEKDFHRYDALYEQNQDLAGWLAIDGTRINYPVMSTPENPEYYIHREFEKAYSISGTPFLGKGCDMDSDNIIVYGHNMRNGTMFHDLLAYRDEDYYMEHRTIRFDSVTEPREYEVIGAFYTKAYQTGDNVFRYYDYGGELDEEQFTSYVRQIQKNTLYDSGITPEYGDQLLTLSTCSYHVTDGRFVVVARLKTTNPAETMENGENPETLKTVGTDT